MLHLKMLSMAVFSALVVSCLSTTDLFAQASPPQLLTLQGRLTDASGVPQNGSVNIVVKFYDAAAGGNLLLTDSHTGAGAVTVTNGIYNIQLGGGTITAGTQASLYAVFQNVQNVYAALTVAADAEMTPRMQILSAGYSVNTHYLDGYASSAYVRVTPTAGGQMIYSDGTPVWTLLGAGSSGQPLLSGGAGAPTWGTLGVANGGTGTTTTFTQGSVVFAGAGGVYSQNNANFFWDNTNLRLGIGTSAPKQRMDVSGEINVNSNGSTENGVGFGAIAVSSGAVSGTWGQQGSISAICWSNGNFAFHAWPGPGTSAGGLLIWEDGTGDAIQVTEAGATTFAVKKGGSVGVGTDAPARLLDVSGHFRATGGLASPPAIDTNYPSGHMTVRSQAHMFVEGGNGYNTHLCGNLYWDGTNWNLFNTAVGGCFWWAGSSGTAALYTAAAAANPSSPTAKISIDNSGNSTFYGWTTSGGAYVNVYATQHYVTGGNMHVLGNEQASGQAAGVFCRLRVGNAWNFPGIYSDTNSNGTSQDLVIGASSTKVRVGPDNGGQYLSIYMGGTSGNAIYVNGGYESFYGTNVSGGYGVYTAATGTGGWGIYAHGNSYGGFIVSDTTYASYFTGSGNYAYVAGNGWKIVGSGGVSEIVPTATHGRVTLTCPESPEYWYQDFGTAELVDGRVHVDLDPILLYISQIDDANPIRVITQVNSADAFEVSVVKGPTGFDLVERGSGRHSCSIDYEVIVRPKTNYGQGRFPQAPGPGFLHPEDEPRAAHAVNRPDRTRIFHWPADWDVYGYDPARHVKIGEVVPGGPKKGLIRASETEYITQQENDRRAQQTPKGQTYVPPGSSSTLPQTSDGGSPPMQGGK